MRKFHFIPQQTEKSAFGSCESSRCWTTLSRFILEILSDLKLFNPKALAQPKYRFFRLLGYIFVGLIFFLSFSSCSYHLDGPGRLEQLTTLSIPYVQGDSSGQLTSELAKQISASGAFDYVQNNGQLILKVKVLTDGSERLGYRYDRKGVQGKRKKFLMPVEGRRMINAEVTLIRASTEEVVIGPIFVKADSDYDYYDPESIRDLSFVTNQGYRVATINFSLGQLDSIEGAVDDVAVPVYHSLAQKIVDGIISQNWATSKEFDE